MSSSKHYSLLWTMPFQIGRHARFKCPLPRFNNEVCCALSHSQFVYIYRILYNSGMTEPKPIEFRGNSLDDLRAFPLPARREAGHQLDQVQNGQDSDNWKPMNTVGQGVKEIRILDTDGAFRVLYVAKFAAAIYVLHCFQKKTEKTSRTDLDLAAKRYRDLLKELGQ